MNATPYESTSPYASVLNSTGSSENSSIPFKLSSCVFVSCNPSSTCVLNSFAPFTNCVLPVYAEFVPSFNVFSADFTCAELLFSFDKPLLKFVLPFDNTVVPVLSVFTPSFSVDVPAFTCDKAVFKLCTPVVILLSELEPACNACVPAYNEVIPSFIVASDATICVFC